MLFSLVCAIVCVFAVFGHALEEARGMQAGYLFANETVKSDLSCSYSATCSAGGNSGVCVSISAGCCSGTVTSNLCPGSTDIKCCTLSSCSTPSGSGHCMSTSSCSSKGGKSVAGYCTGPSDLQCCVTSAPTSSSYGYDISQSMGSSTAFCLASNGYSFAIPRGYKSTGAVDTAVCTSIKSAHSAGAKVRDAYLFPCPTCSKSAATQMNELVSHLKSNCNSEWSGRVWLDVEGSQYWTGSTSKNQDWYKNLRNACTTYGVKCGVYSSASQWSAIFGSTSFTYGNDLPLWYAHYDNNPSFSDYSKFGGWSSPHAKQYAGDATVCSFGIDKNYSPSF